MIKFRMEKEIEMPCCIKADYEYIGGCVFGELVRCKKCGRYYLIKIAVDEQGKVKLIMKERTLND